MVELGLKKWNHRPPIAKNDKTMEGIYLDA